MIQCPIGVGNFHCGGLVYPQFLKGWGDRVFAVGCVHDHKHIDETGRFRWLEQPQTLVDLQPML